eukprot:759143_1
MALKVYLNDQMIELSVIQKQQISEIIQSPIPPQQITAKKNVNAKSDLEDKVPSQYAYEFDVNNTLIDSLCSDTHVPKLKQCINHKLIIISFGVIAISTSLIASQWGMQSLFFTVLSIIGICVIELWLISKHLICNKEALKLCLRSFDYWIKVGYSLIWSIDNMLDSSALNRYFILVLGTSFISVLDASPYQYKTKMLLPTMLAILFSFFSLSAFLSGEQDCHGPNTISIKSMAASSNRILCLFFWKQVFQTWRHKNSGSASTLTKPTKILWIDHDNTSTTPQAQHNEQTTDTVVHLDEKKIAEIQQSDLDLKTLEEGPDDRYDDSLSKKESLSASTETN